MVVKAFGRLLSALNINDVNQNTLHETLNGLLYSNVLQGPLSTFELLTLVKKFRPDFKVRGSVETTPFIK